MFDLTTPPRTLRVNRRSFLQATAVAGLDSMLNGQLNSLAAEEASPAVVALQPTGQDVGSLFPFIQSQVQTGPLTTNSYEHEIITRCPPPRLIVFHPRR